MQLLVSVRSATEALAALEGGADLIDVKEPARGSLGKPDDGVIEEVRQLVIGKAKISAAAGELKDLKPGDLPSWPLDYIKFGLSGSRGQPWQEGLLRLQKSSLATVVPAMYADSDRAEAPGLLEVVEFAIDHRFPVLLIDTFGKDGRGLFEWLSERQLADAAKRLRRGGIQLALAGSLKMSDLPRVRAINPDWLAVRGAVCPEGNRLGEIDADRIAAFKRAI